MLYLIFMDILVNAVNDICLYILNLRSWSNAQDFLEVVNNSDNRQTARHVHHCLLIICRNLVSSVRFVKKPWGVERRRPENRGAEGTEGEGRGEGVFSCPGKGHWEPSSDRKFLTFLSFQNSAFSGAFSHTNQMQRKVSSHAILGDWRWYRHENIKFHSYSIGMCYRPKIIVLCELQTQTTL